MTDKTDEKGAFGAIESTAKSAVEQGEKVWLAGLGVLARAQEDGRDWIQDGRDWIGADKVKYFDELVESGREFADQARSNGEAQFENTRETIRNAFATARDQAKNSYDRAVTQTEANVEKVAETLGIEQIFDRRVERAMQRLGYPSVKELKALTKKTSAPKRKAAAPKAKVAKKKTTSAAKKSA